MLACLIFKIALDKTIFNEEKNFLDVLTASFPSSIDLLLPIRSMLDFIDTGCSSPRSMHPGVTSTVSYT